jgi:nucleotide-binding universal stress UspA family protein
VARSLGYRRILVPIGDSAQSEKAMDVACRLAADRGASITAVRVVEVPPLLPLDAHMTDEEAQARPLLDRASAIADSYGVHHSSRILRGREAAHAIIEQATADHVEIIVIGSPRKPRASGGAGIFGTTTEHVLKQAACRVMVVATPLAANALRHVAA